MTYEELQIQHDALNIVEMDLSEVDGLKGLCIGENIAIEKKGTIKEKSCILAEELGHYYTTCGNILDQSNILNQKQELRARVWAYQRLITMEKLISAYNKGCKNAYEIAEDLDVTENFLIEALTVFKQKYYPYIQYKNYLIQFEPTLQIYKFVD